LLDKPLDIFRLEPDGTMMWVEAVADFETAVARIESLAQQEAEYYVFDLRTGSRTIVGVERRQAASSQEQGAAAD
jgi:hypothetical protein